jgi:hypothetical protein
VGGKGNRGKPEFFRNKMQPYSAGARKIRVQEKKEKENEST